MPIAMLIQLLAAAAEASGHPAPGDATRYPLGCAYVSAVELDHADHCAVEGSDGVRIAPAIIAQLAYERGLASIAVQGHPWAYRRRDGRTVEMLTFENGPDPFSQGLARARIGGGLAYVDRRLRVRIRTRYTFGEPFEHGRAVVCIGCVEVREDGGEHSTMVGGRWGVIDRSGRAVVPPTLTAEELARLPPGINGRRRR